MILVFEVRTFISGCLVDAEPAFFPLSTLEDETVFADSFVLTALFRDFNFSSGLTSFEPAVSAKRIPPMAKAKRTNVPMDKKIKFLRFSNRDMLVKSYPGRNQNQVNTVAMCLSANHFH